MKVRKYCSLLTALVMVCALLLAGCGGGETEEAGALTEEEYEAAVVKLGEDFTTIQNDAAALDVTDPEAALQLLEDCKAPLEEFIAIVPPAVYAEAHAKLVSGSQAMISFLDTTGTLVGETDATKIQEVYDTMMEQIQTATNDMTEGADLLAEAAGE